MIKNTVVEIQDFTTTLDDYGIPVKTWAKVADVEIGLQPTSPNPQQVQAWGITNESVILGFCEPGEPISRGNRMIYNSQNLEVIEVHQWDNHKEVWAKVVAGEQ